MHVPFKLILAVAIFSCSMSVLYRAISLHTQPWNAAEFAEAEADARGIDWPLESISSNGLNEHRALFQSPHDPELYADMTVRFHAGQWSVVSFRKDFRPWGLPADATASR